MSATTRSMTEPTIDTFVDYRVVKRRNLWPWILAAVTLIATLGFVQAMATNENLDWTVVGKYLFSPLILEGVWVTIQLSLAAMVVAIVLGLAIGLARMSANRVLSGLASVYTTIFRGVPMLVQLILWGNIGLIFQNLSIGIPFTDFIFFSVPTNAIITPFTAAIIGLALAEAAYIAEIVRAGILSVDRGQIEASHSLGMTPGHTTRRIVLPQALRLIIPPTGNEFVSLIKATSLVAVIAGGDLLTQAQNLAATSYRVIEMMAVATFWYIVIVTVASIGQHYLERSFSKGHH